MNTQQEKISNLEHLPSKNLGQEKLNSLNNNFVSIPICKEQSNNVSINNINSIQNNINTLNFKEIDDTFEILRGKMKNTDNSINKEKLKLFYTLNNLFKNKSEEIKVKEIQLKITKKTLPINSSINNNSNFNNNYNSFNKIPSKNLQGDGVIHRLNITNESQKLELVNSIIKHFNV